MKKHPLGPKIVFSYGMTKCGSTLAFELARSGLELAGFEQPVLSAPGLRPNNSINFAGHLSHTELSQIWAQVQDIGHPIVIKTHTRPDPCVIELINNGHAIAQATYRDPRDMALSMMDHGAKNRALGRAAFSEISDLDDAKENITSQIDSLTQWLVRPNCLPLYYDDLAFDTETATRKILAQLLLDYPAGKVSRFVQNRRFTQKNKGIKNRFATEMPKHHKKSYKSAFAPFHNALIKNRNNITFTGKPILKDGTVLLAN